MSDCNHIHTVYKRHEGAPREEKQLKKNQFKKQNYNFKEIEVVKQKLNERCYK